MGICYNTLYFSVFSKNFLKVIQRLRQKSFLKENFNEQNCELLGKHGYYFIQI